MSGTLRSYSRVDSLEELEGLVKTLMASKSPLGFDIETGYRGPYKFKGALDPQRAFIVGFSITSDPSWARYVPIDHGAEFPDLDNLPAGKVWEMMRPVLMTKKLVIHNLRFEVSFLTKVGIDIPIENIIDTMLLSYVAGDRQRHGLKYLTKEVLDEHQTELGDLFQRPDPITGKAPRRRKDIRFNLLDSHDRDVIEYACADSALALELLAPLEKGIRKEQRFIRKLESTVVGVVADMERRGLTVNWKAMHESAARGQIVLMAMESELRQLLTEAAGRDCSTLNFGSAPQMRKLLYDPPEEGGLGLKAYRYTDTGEKSTDAQTIKNFEAQVPAFKFFRQFKEASNTLTKIQSWIEDFSNAPDGKIHPSYMQTVVPSGRFSANLPNIQQVQKDWAFSTTDGSETWMGNFRNFIVASPGHYFLTYDVSQIELRMLAGLSKERVLLEAFSKGQDIHAATASAMLGKPLAEITKEDRARGKCLPGSTLIRTRDGLVRLDSLCPERRPEHIVPTLGSGMQVWDGARYRDILSFYCDGPRPVWEIRTARGYQVTATGEHPWWTPTGWVKTSQLVPDSSWVAMSLGGAPVGDPITVPFSPSGGSTSEASPTIKVTEDWAAVAALADYAEWTNSAQTMPGGTTMYTIPKPPGDVSTRLRQHFLNVGVKPREVDTMEANRDLAFASSWFGPAVAALRKDESVISSAILASPASVQAAYLRTLFDIAARVERKEIRLLLPDEPARLIQILLAGLSIRTQLQWATKAEVTGHYVGLEDDDPSGWSSLLIEDLRDLTRYRSIVGTSCRASRRKLQGWGEDFSTPIHGDWDLVADVRYIGRQPVFDLTVDVSSRFEANGLIGSNTLNFGLLYGMGIRALAEDLELGVDEATDLYRGYFASFVRIKSWVSGVKNFGKNKKYVETHFKRRVSLPEFDKGDRKSQAKGERIAVNAPVQGSAADSMKIVMVRVKQVLQEKGWWDSKVFLVMNLHDALTFEVAEGMDPAELRDVLTPIVEMHRDRDGYLRGFPNIEVEWDIGYAWGLAMSWPKDAAVVFEDGRWKVVREGPGDGGDSGTDSSGSGGDGAGPVAQSAGQPPPPGLPRDNDHPKIIRNRAGAPGYVESDPPMGIPRPIPSPEGQTSQVNVAVLEPPPPAPPTETSVVVEIELPEIDRETFAGFKQLLDSTPGPYRCVIIMGGQRRELSVGTSLTEENRFEIQRRVPGAMIRRTGIDLALGDGLLW